MVEGTPLVQGSGSAAVVLETGPAATPRLSRSERLEARARRAPRRGTKGGLAAAFAAYLALAVVLLWHAWTNHPTTTGICGCGDPALFLWFMEWPAHALAHGLSPFYSSAMLHPHGVNLLANTSQLAVGFVLAPVTLIFGPVASVNVALTLAPAVSAAAAYWLLRRWVTWWPAAFAGGLLYGYSAFMLAELSGSYLMMTVVPVPPLLFACLEELFVRQRRSPAVIGSLIALLAALQFFLSTEVLLMVAFPAVIGTVLLGLWVFATDREAFHRRLPHALRGAAWAAGVGFLLLAWPVWYTLAGPGHFSGPIWLVSTLPYAGNSWSSYWHAGYNTASSWNSLKVAFGGYQGHPILTPAYLGIGVLVTVIAGWALWWRDRRLLLLGTLTLSTMLLALGNIVDKWSPWRLFTWLPQMENIIPGRFSIVINLLVAGMLAVVLDHVVRAVRLGEEPDLVLAAGSLRRRWSPATARTGRSASPLPTSSEPSSRTPTRTPSSRTPTRTPSTPAPSTPAPSAPAPAVRRHRPGPGRQVVGALVGVTLAVVALFPAAAAELRYWPLTMVHVVVPSWFTDVAPDLPGHQVVLTYPYASSGIQSPLAWQAVAGMPYAMVGGGGPGGAPARAGTEEPGNNVLAALSQPSVPEPAPTPSNLAAVRDALRGWGVTMAVIPDLPGQPSSIGGRDARYAVRFTTAALGRRPHWDHGAWVWSHVQQDLRALP